jgi:hypothetical protein
MNGGDVPGVFVRRVWDRGDFLRRVSDCYVVKSVHSRSASTDLLPNPFLGWKEESVLALSLELQKTFRKHAYKICIGCF